MIHYNIPFSEYRKLPGLSVSRLKSMKISPAHYLYEGENKDSPEKMLGRLVDCLITTPSLFETSYFVYEALPRKNSKEYTEIVSLANGREIIDKEELGIAESIKTSFMLNRLCSGLLNGALSQLSLTWETREGLLCKGRPDLFNRDLNILIDVKTTKDARPQSFQRSAEDYCYFHQLEFYRRGLIASGETVSSCMIVALETRPPYKGVQVYELSEADLESAGAEIDEWLKKYKYCVDTGEFPCYPEVVEKLYRPAWTKK